MISGSGTTLQSMIDSIRSGVLNAEIVVIISSHSSAYGIKRAEQAGIPVFVASTAARSPEIYSNEILEALKSYQVDLVVMAGFIKKYVPTVNDLPTINIHPSLLPSFGGKGMYGRNVHQAVKNYGCKLAGCTVHFVSEEYDTGPIIAQESIAVSHDDSVEQIEINVQALEKKVLIKTLIKFTEGKISLENRTVTVL
jgi:phosphoribosylglycinamide formyltransferase-1